MTLRLARSDDAAAIAAIYAPYVTNSALSFETDAPDADAMAARIEDGGDLYPWLVTEGADGGITGYAYACAFRARHAYRFTVETTIYVAERCHGRGVGRRLYEALLPILEAQGFTQAIAAITLPNPGSVRLHERFGFSQAGCYRDVGFKLGDWHSVSLWQRALARQTGLPDEPRPFAPFLAAYLS